MNQQLMGGNLFPTGEVSRRNETNLGRSILMIILSAIALAQSGSPVHAADVVKTNYPVADAYVRSGFSASKNFGTEPVVEIQSNTVDGTKEGYLKFDLSGLDPTLSKAKLRVYAKVSSAGSIPILVRSVVRSDWSEKEIKWRDKPEHIKTVGNLDVVGVSFAWYELDLTDYLRSELTGGAKDVTLAFLLGEGSSKKVSIKSREADGQKPELVVTRKDYNIKISFLPGDGALPAGYLPDNGKVYGERGNGYSYGWSQDCTEFMRDRSQPAYGFGSPNAIAAPDHRYEVLGCFDHYKMKQPSFWEIGVPNGYYKVHVVSGDTMNFDSVYALDVEGVLTVDGIPDTKNRWAEGTKTVSVKDGRMTLKNHPTASANKICFIEIEEAKGP